MRVLQAAPLCCRGRPAAAAVPVDGDALVAEAATDAAKERVRAQTDDAIAGGVFGVPTMQVGDELFWGYDDLPFLERHLAGGDPLDARAWQEWQTSAPRPSATRPRRR